ncbi:v-Bcl-2-like protein [Cricetid gammaherpesvirus 2]|uniref:V-Bcl-2-like protein n=1 Tax=Cricetid gammaherpesvirus 2 TaxID=1605972 RepID=E9M5Q5_9GAMA|nr:v-Bcl-2-like protein [Cricetid gammaherpesvirus 2]ADW24413.1 v-Bcl-2-like protein [Cricetid gammaherpesvirus 2]ADW24495.1 v-Bcl-2-like protein [Cricetid gammaherpesvirus 2]
MDNLTEWRSLLKVFLLKSSGCSCQGVSAGLLADVDVLDKLTTDFITKYESVYGKLPLTQSDWVNNITALLFFMLDKINFGRFIGLFAVGKFVCQELLLSSTTWSMAHDLLFHKLALVLEVKIMPWLTSMGVGTFNELLGRHAGQVVQTRFFYFLKSMFVWACMQLLDPWPFT